MNFELIGNRFSELRKKNGFTQSQVAEYLEVDQSYISKCESNERQFSVDILEKAAELFGCTLRYFLNDTSGFEPITVALRSTSFNGADPELGLALRDTCKGSSDEVSTRIRLGLPTE